MEEIHNSPNQFLVGRVGEIIIIIIIPSLGEHGRYGVQGSDKRRKLYELNGEALLRFC